MRTFYFSLLLLSCSLSALINTNHATQVDQLRRLIKSQRSSTSLHSDSSWHESFSTNMVSSSQIDQYIGSDQDGRMAAADMIDELPGQPKGANFNQYAGYVTVDPKNRRALFYYFVESPHNTSTKLPLLLWLNGGPGCSSLGYGAMEEIGPFRVNRNGKTLSRNNYAWNNVANVIFLESPAGVGFSYSNTTRDYDESGDERTASDSYTFLLNWLERFPQYKTRDFFIAGESYAGHYIPELAYTILQSNKVTKKTVINLRGIAIGNAYVDRVANDIGGYEYRWSHALISDETYTTLLSSCNFSSEGMSKECEAAMTSADNESGAIDDYNIYAPLCHDDSDRPTGSSFRMADFDPCSDKYVYNYLNNPAVQRALHANVTALPYPWQSCSPLGWHDSPETMTPIIKQLIASGINLWLYSGDVDGVVPISSTRNFIKILGLPVKHSWRAWYVDNEVGGYVEEYNGLVLATVRGAGHAVPSYQPIRALTMISSFLEGKLPQ